MKKINLLLPFALILARWKKEVCLLLFLALNLTDTNI